jgi:HK97 family phage major capsid protein
MLEIVKRALKALIEKRAAMFAELSALPTTAEAESRGLNPDEQTRADTLIAEIGTVDAEIVAHERRVAELVEIEQRAAVAEQTLAKAGLQVIRRPEPAAVADVRSMSAVQLIDLVKRGAEAHDIDGQNAAKVMHRYRNSGRVEVRQWAENLAARSTEVYARAFQKVMTGNLMALTDEERTAMSVGTAANGGYLVPTHLDPTVILTNTGTSNVIRMLSRVVTQVVGKTWNGVTSAGVSASFDAELAEVSDDSPTFGNPQVNLHTARAFVQSSIEAVEDIDTLGSEVLMMFADARDRLEASKHASGSGTAEPFGIFTAITGSQSVTSTTAATIGLVDLLAVKTAVPQRFRGRSAWVYNPTYGDAIRQLGTALSANYTVNATESNTEKLVGRPVYESDDAPTTQTTTVKDPELILGDFSNYLIADKPGSFSVQYVPVMFNTATNLPDGRVGWFAWWRTGADSINDAAFRVLLDKTSA